MTRDRPARNPRLSPAGLPPDETDRHRHIRPGGTDSADPAATACRFVSSHGGTMHCRAEPYQAAFCRFHHECLVNGEISPLGRILDRVQDQARRRAINLYGHDLPHLDRLDEDPITGSREDT